MITSDLDIVAGRLEGFPKRKGCVVLSKSLQNSSTIEKISVILSKQIIEQVPPIYSSVKVDGRRAYSYARAGEELVIKSRNITTGYFFCL